MKQINFGSLTSAVEGKTVAKIDIRHSCRVAQMHNTSPASIVFIQFADGSAVEFISDMKNTGCSQSVIDWRLLTEQDLEDDRACEPYKLSMDHGYNSEYMRDIARHAD